MKNNKLKRILINKWMKMIHNKTILYNQKSNYLKRATKYLISNNNIQLIKIKMHL